MNIVLYTTQDGQARFNLQAFDEQLWLTQADIAALYQISPHPVSCRSGLS